MKTTNMSSLEVKCLRKRFPSPDGGDTLVVDVERFSLESGAHCAMKGESGSGKTTFLHLVAGILVPDEGEIILDGFDVSQLSESSRDRLRADSIGYVFQSFNLLQGFTCQENVLLAMSFSGQADRMWAKKLLERVVESFKWFKQLKLIQVLQQVKVMQTFLGCQYLLHQNQVQIRF